MEIRATIAKVDRYSSLEHGDKVEVIERPNGGLSFILAEGKLNGKHSKAITMKAVHKMLNLISEGVHDGAASRAVLSGINNEHMGKAEVLLSVLSLDLESQTIVLTKNNNIPVYLIRNGFVEVLQIAAEDDRDLPLDPIIYQFQLENETGFVLVSDGVFQAGKNSSERVEIHTIIQDQLDDRDPTVSEMANLLLNQAISLDVGKPRDDMTVIVLRIAPAQRKGIRKVSIHFPIQFDKN